MSKSPADHKRYWRSLNELADTAEFRAFVEAEFPQLAPELERAAGPTRRQFLKVIGASLAFAGMTGCRWPKEVIVPATRQSVEKLPGQPVKYASSVELGGVGYGLLVTSVDGRPIKIDGNNLHPLTRGRSTPWMQATILDLYDPDRSTWPVRRPDDLQPNRRWNELAAALRAHFGQVQGRNGKGLAVLAEPTSSPTLLDMRQRFMQAFPAATWHTHDPLDRENEVAGLEQVFGRRLRPRLLLEKADVVLCLDADILQTHPAGLQHARDFATRRRADDGTMNRLYALESNLSVTGAMADHRWAVRSTRIPAVLNVLRAAIRAAKEHRGDFTPEVPAGVPITAEELQQIAADLVSLSGHAVIAAGPQQPAEVHAIVHALNVELGAVDHTIRYTEEPAAEATLAELVAKINADAVDTLLILGGNPLYDAPADLDFDAALGKVDTAIHLSVYDNETSQRCQWHVPMAHVLESWGDTRSWDGTISLTQPLIAPLYDGKTASELLALLIDDDETAAHKLTQRAFREYAPGPVTDFESAWNQALHDGVVAETAWAPVRPSVQTTPPDAPEAEAADYDVQFAADHSLRDGRFANNAWLQEWPDPITKLTWDNAALISPADAGALGVSKPGDLVQIDVDGRTLEMPAFPLPGHAAGAVTLPLGYGREKAAGVVAVGAGFDTYKLRTSENRWLAVAKVTGASGHYKLVGTQDHHAIKSQVGDQAIPERVETLAREGTLGHYQAHPEFAKHMVHHPPLKSLWEEKSYETGHKWGMAIDLSTCIGCGACTLACQSENNIPVVGKDEVAMGREMHWIRVDRYFKGEPEDPRIQVTQQPVTCVQCENAPCEQVCPVAATVHDTEGLNNMVYNRCIGTRYCSNNCPYKVRRFNWFYNHHGPYHPRSQNAEQVSKKDRVNLFPGELKKKPVTHIEEMINNPEVTVRSRGVMEKCTFCIQRISRTKIQARNERWDKIPDGEITTACQDACPTNAIVFGDLNDADSEVSKLHKHNRSYAMLAFLNVKPRLHYLAKLRNPAGDADGHGDAGKHGGHGDHSASGH
jgi:MoCo/4Fe-4S cofactor protein with predicted Tat translocation signal